MSKELTVYEFPVKDAAVYIDNQLFQTGEQYMIPRMMKEAINEHNIGSARIERVNERIGRGNVPNSREEFSRKFVK